MSTNQFREPTITCVMGTNWKNSLAAAVVSVASQFTRADEILVVSDGPQPKVKQVVDAFALLGVNIKYIEGPETGFWGYAQRELGLKLATKDYIIYLNDDDRYFPGAIRRMREEIKRAPGDLFCCLMYDSKNNWVYGTQHRIEQDYIGDVMLIMPNDKTKLGWYTPGRIEDLLFVKNILTHFPKGLHWIDVPLYNWNAYSDRDRGPHPSIREDRTKHEQPCYFEQPAR